MKNNMPQALALAARGFRVFPLHSPDGDKCDCRRADCSKPAKHPRTRHGLTDATTDEAEVRRWWGMWPQANVGVATGPESGLIVLDVDARHGGLDTWTKMLAQYGDPSPDGPIAFTGGGGYHYWFLHPGSYVPSRNGQVAEGIDVKGDGGYVVAPPSVHSTGVSYVWCDDHELDQTVVQAAPEWLLKRMRERMEAVNGQFQPKPRFDEVVPEGHRNERLASLGGTIRNKGASEFVIFAALMAFNEDQCRPSLERTEVAQIAASIARYEPMPETPLIVSKRRDEGAGYLPQPFSATELMAYDLPEVRWAVPGLIPEGLGILAGKPKMGKSWLSFHLGIAIAEGGVAMSSIPVESGDVLILAMEDNKRRLKKRLKTLIQDEAPPERLFFELKWPREDEGGLEALDTWLGQHPQTRLVVIDTLAKFRKKSGDPKYSDDYASMEGLQQLAGKHGICILLIHHLRKALSDDWVDTISGTLGIAGAADTLLGLEGKRGERDAILHMTGRDIEDDRDLALERDPLTGVWTIIGDAVAYKLGKETELLVAVLKELEHPAGPAEIAPLIGKTRAATKMLLMRAGKAGHIKSYGNGQYGDFAPPTGPFSPISESDVTVLPGGGKSVKNGAGNTGNIKN